jgi:T-complex protein 1 subunit alpha
MAAVAISNVVKSSLGPVGLDKMLVDDVGVSTFHSNGLLYIYNILYLIH